MSTITAAEIKGRPSHDDLRQLIRRALTGGAEVYGPGTPYVLECTDTDCIVERDGKHWRYPYTVAEDGGSVTLGDPVEARLSWRDAGTVQAGEGDRERHYLATDVRGLTFSEVGGRIETTIEVCRDSTRHHPKYGQVVITPEMRETMVRNFEERVREVDELPIDYDHKDGPAGGWIFALRNEGSSLFADVWLPPSAAARIRSGEYRYFSPEYHPNYANPKTGVKHGPTLLGGGWTNRPEFRELPAVTCSEHNGAPPQKETQMPETNPGAPQNDAGAQQFSEMQERMRLLEERNRALELAEDRRQLGQTFSELRFHEGRQSLAPATRTALTDALLPLAAEQREKVIEAVKNLQFVEFGERGWVNHEAPDPKAADKPTDAEKAELLAMTPVGQVAAAAARS